MGRKQASGTQYPSVLIDRFYGSSGDKSGEDQVKGVFSLLTNYRVNLCESLLKRGGGTKVFSQTENTGSISRGVFTYYNDSGTASYIKACGGKIYKSSGGAWTQIGATTFNDSDTWFASLKTRKTGAGANTSGTATATDSTSITDTGQAWTTNAYVGQIVNINSEQKLISANNATKLILGEHFDDTPGLVAYNVYPRQIEFFFANGTDFYKCDGTTFTRLDNAAFSFAFNGIEAHNGRIWGWIGTRLHWSDAGLGEQFSRNAWRDFDSPIVRVKAWGDVLMIYEKEKITAMYGDSPDNFQFKEIYVGTGTEAPKSVCNVGSYQMFLAKQTNIGVVMLALSDIDHTYLPTAPLVPLSITDGYYRDEIEAQSQANKQAACAEFHGQKMHLCIGSTWYVLDMQSSILATAESGGRTWVWTKDTRPSAMNMNVLGHFDQKFVGGSQSSGQVYELETGTSDDGTDITATWEKAAWNLGNSTARKKLYSINVVQEISASAIAMNYYFSVDRGSYPGSADKVITLNAVGNDELSRIIAPGNPSDRRDTGRIFSIKCIETGSLGGTNVRQIEAFVFPGIPT